MADSGAAPHVLAIPFPLHGHISPMVDLCAYLAASGALITFAISRDQNSRLRSLLEQPKSEASGLNSKVKVIVASFDVIAPAGSSRFSASSIAEFMDSFEDLAGPLEDAVREEISNSQVKFSCVISDVHVGWAQDLADRLNVPRIALWTTNLAECALHFYMPTLIAKGVYPFKTKYQQNCNGPELISDIPGLPPIHQSDFPCLPHNPGLGGMFWFFFIRQTRRMPETNRILVNSFYELEKDTFDAMRKELPIHPIGPLFLASAKNGIAPKSSEDQRSKSSSNQANQILKWLEKQKPKSVLYIAFGTLAKVPPDQLEELAIGLELSKQPFLWSFRADLGVETESKMLKNFLNRYREGEKQGMVVNWAPQSEILEHRSVAAFITHCGWNSVMESVCLAMPMIAWPQGADQFLSCRLMVEHWKIAVRLNRASSDNGYGGLDRSEVVGVINSVVGGCEGEILRANLSNLRDQARRSLAMESSESRRNLENLVRDLHRGFR